MANANAIFSNAGFTGTRRAPDSEYDAMLVWSSLLLLALGLVMVYSASIAIAESGPSHQPMYFLIRHGIYLALGLVCGVIAFEIPMRGWKKLAPWLFLIGIVLLIAVLIPGLGHVVNGSRRWISFIIFNLQPSELMKLFVVLYAADYTVRKAAHMHSLRHGFFPMSLVIALVAVLLLLEPDFGAFSVIVAIAMGILFLGGMNWKLFAGVLGILAMSFVTLIVASPYRLQRLIGFMNPWADPFGKGYQLTNALMAFGRGEWFGVGLGASVEKLSYLPEAHTDFLLAIIGEELGLIGVIVVLTLFTIVVARAFTIGRQAALLERNFSALVAQGIAIWLGTQAFINMAVNMGLLPTKGLTLPLLSFGGSGLVVNCVALAILLRIDYENRQCLRGLDV